VVTTRSTVLLVVITSSIVLQVVTKSSIILQVVWLSHGMFKSSCDISVEYFPFDIQDCQMKWASWTYDGFSVRQCAFLISPKIIIIMIIIIR
jgi:hypothetical protein